MKLEMKKQKFGLLLFMIGISFNGFSQLTDFDLSKYKLPDLERHSLETNFNISGYNNYIKNPYQTFYGYNEYGNNQYNGDILINYNHYLNNFNLQRETNFRFDLSSSFYTRKEDKTLQSRNNTITPSLYYQRNNRKYYNGRSFFETDLVLNYQYTGIFSKNSTYDNEDKTQTHTILAQVPLKLGIGRIEQVQDARHAIYIFEELAKINRATTEKSEEEIIEFAHLISKLKNKRFFDSRLRRMNEIESVDSFFQSKNYVSVQDAKYFTTLSDFWDYGNRPIRNSGTRFSAAILPGYYYYNFNNSVNEIYVGAGKYSVGAFLINGGIELKHEKPINLFWQNSIDINCYAGLMEGKLNDKTDESDNKIRIPNIQLGFYQKIGFYPNTRTDLSFKYSVQYVQLFDKTDLGSEVLGAEGKGAKATAEFSLNYYISPKFRFNILSSFYYIWQDSKDEVIINFDNVAGSNYLSGNVTSAMNGNNGYFKLKELANSFRISLIYSIF